VKGAARRIEHRPECDIQPLGGVACTVQKALAPPTCWRVHPFPLFFFYLIYTNTKLPLTHTILTKKKHTILHQKEVKIENAPPFIVKKIQILRVF